MKTFALLICNLSAVLSFSNFIIEFKQLNCSEYLKFQGDDSYIYLFKEHQLTLMISHKKSYEIYTYPMTPDMLNFTFQWPEMLVNNEQMNLNWQEGDVIWLSNYTSYHILCEPLYITSYLPTELNPLTYKCSKTNRDWLIVSIGLVLFIIIYGSGTAAPVISEDIIPRILGRGREVLSRSKEDPPEYYSETDQAISEDSISIHFTQTAL